MQWCESKPARRSRPQSLPDVRTHPDLVEVCQLRELEREQGQRKDRIHHQRRIDLPWQENDRGRPGQCRNVENQVATVATQGSQPATKWYRWPGESEPFSVNSARAWLFRICIAPYAHRKRCFLKSMNVSGISPRPYEAGTYVASYPASKYAARAPHPR